MPTLQRIARLHEISLPVSGTLVHLRFFPPVQKQPIEIDWIDVGSASGNKESTRWDFGVTVESSAKPKGKKK